MWKIEGDIRSGMYVMNKHSACSHMINSSAQWWVNDFVPLTYDVPRFGTNIRTQLAASDMFRSEDSPFLRL